MKQFLVNYTSASGSLECGMIIIKYFLVAPKFIQSYFKYVTVYVNFCVFRVPLYLLIHFLCMKLCICMQICCVNCQFYLLVLVTTFVLIFFCFLGRLQELSPLSVLFHCFYRAPCNADAV